MQFTRTIKAAVAAAVLIAPLAMAPSSADATPKPHRQFVNTDYDDSGSDIKFFTTVSGYHNGVTILQKKTCKTCAWFNKGRKNTGDHGYVKYSVGAPSHGKWFWRITTPERQDWAESHSPVLTTFRT